MHCRASGSLHQTDLPTPRFGYTGQEFDVESGLVYMNARHYDPAAQRFISPHPVGEGTREGQASRPYAYVANDPMNRTDPLGLFGVNKNPYAGGTLLHGGASTGRVVQPAAPTGGGMALGDPVVAGIGVGFTSGFMRHEARRDAISASLSQARAAEARDGSWGWLRYGYEIYQSLAQTNESIQREISAEIFDAGNSLVYGATAQVMSDPIGFRHPISRANRLMHSGDATLGSTMFSRIPVVASGYSVVTGRDAATGWELNGWDQAARVFAFGGEVLTLGAPLAGRLRAPAASLTGGNFGVRSANATGGGTSRVTQFYDPSKGAFPIDGRYALSAKPTLGNRIVDGIAGETTWVVPRPAAEMTWWRRLMTGVGNRRFYVEFDALHGELQAPGGIKSVFANYQQVVPGRVDLLARNPAYGVSSFNFLDAGVRYVAIPAGAAGGGYLIYKEVTDGR